VTTDISALRLYVRIDEGEGPVMVLLHGINSDATDWRKVIDTIGDGYRFIAPDLLGFGESPKPEDIEYTADDHMQVLEATLKDLGVDRPFMLVGYSLGGDIAIRYASTYPEKLRRLFLLSAPFYLPPEAFQKQGFGIQYLKVIFFEKVWKFISNSQKSDNRLYQYADGKGQEFAKQFFRTDDIPKHWDIMSKNLRNCIGAATFVDDLPKLSMPVTFALGIRDPIVHPDQTPDLKRLKPDIDIRRIVGLSADHFLLANIPETVAHEIMRDEVRELAVRYRAGSGEPTVFLHGIFEDPTFWQPVATALSARREVAMFDLLGFGESPKPLSSLYTVADHVDAVVHTLLREYPKQRVRLVGHAFGAAVALSVAEAAPKLVADVVAFSPLLLAPKGEEGSISTTAAEIETMHERIEAMASDRRSRIAADRAEQHVIPLLRTVQNSVLHIDAAALIDTERIPFQLVLPTDDTSGANDFLARATLKTTNGRVLKAPGSHSLPLDDPGATVLILDPEATAAAKVADKLPRPKPSMALRDLRATFASTANTILWRGLGTLVLGLWILSLNNVNPRLVSIGFAIWVGFEGISTISGAVGLRRTGSTAWVPWMLMGLLSFGVAALLFSRTAFTLQIIAFVIMARALYIGLADLYVATRVSDTPTARWILVCQGLLGVTVALTILFDGQAGTILFKWVIGGYFVLSGASAISYAFANRLAVRKRVRSALAQEKAEEHAR